VPDFRDVDPRELRLPPSMQGGADAWKLRRQIVKYGSATAGTPSPWVLESADGVLVLWDGVTRATRVAKLLPGVLIRVEVTGTVPGLLAAAKTVGDTLP